MITRTNLNCAGCGLTLVSIPREQITGESVKAEYVVADNIQGPPPKPLDAVNITCKCGKVITDFSPENLKVVTIFS